MISQAELQALLNYDPITGIFTWRKKPSRRVCVGSVAGQLRKADGYVVMTIERKPYYAHRLAWLYMTGQWPGFHIDHKNTVRSDNRFKNLRQADVFPNQQNVRVATSRSSTGVLGVFPSGRGYRACVRFDGKGYYSTTFDTTSEAYAAYLSIKRHLHIGCTL